MRLPSPAEEPMPLNLADIPYHILEALVMSACGNEGPKEPPPVADDAISSHSSSYQYTVSESDVLEEEDVCISENDVTDVDKHIRTVLAILGPVEGMVTVRSIIEHSYTGREITVSHGSCHPPPVQMCGWTSIHA